MTDPNLEKSPWRTETRLLTVRCWLKRLLNDTRLQKAVIDQLWNDHGTDQVMPPIFIQKWLDEIKWLVSLRSVELDQPHYCFVDHGEEQAEMMHPNLEIQRLSDLGDYTQRLAVDWTPAEEVMSYIIVPTWRTLYYLPFALSELLWQLTWSGWHQEGRQKEIDQITKSIEAIDPNDPGMTLEELKAEWRDEDGVWDEFDRVEYQLSNQIHCARIQLWLHSFHREANRVKMILRKAGVISG